MGMEKRIVLGILIVISSAWIITFDCGKRFHGLYLSHHQAVPRRILEWDTNMIKDINSSATHWPTHNSTQTKVCVFFGSLSYQTTWKSATDSFPVRYALKGLNNTMEFGKYNYHVYIGIDKGDVFFENASTLTDIQSFFPHIPIHFMFYPNPSKSCTSVINRLAQHLLDDQCQYMYRINDDSESIQPWTSLMIEALQHMSPPNVGMVGPLCRQGNTAILTHDFVHRTHLLMFSEYYPSIFPNWYSDDWITEVYKNLGRMKVMNNVEIFHHTAAQRYVPTMRQHLLSDQVAQDVQQVELYLKRFLVSDASS